MPHEGRTVNEEAVFDLSWLEVREPLDHRSRAPELLPLLRGWWKDRFKGSPGPLPDTSAPEPHTRRIVDLGSGTGSHLRYLAPLLPGPQRWVLVDHDAELLARARAPTEGTPVVEVEQVVRDLTGDLTGLLSGTDLITGSALLDLVSRPWLGNLVQETERIGAAAYFTLTYDGGFRWYEDPGRQNPMEDPDDGTVRNAVNEHQTRDKGFGPALGPHAVPEAARLLEKAGFRTWIRPSPWILGPGDREVASLLLNGWEAAALEARPGKTGEIRAWARSRRSAVDGGRFGLTVGHLDLLALPRKETTTVRGPGPGA